jgi:hypothetical protein
MSKIIIHKVLEYLRTAKISSVVLFKGGYLDFDLAFVFMDLVTDGDDDELLLLEAMGADEKEPAELSEPMDPPDLLVPSTGGITGDTEWGLGGAVRLIAGLNVGDIEEVRELELNSESDSSSHESLPSSATVSSMPPPPPASRSKLPTPFPRPA